MKKAKAKIIVLILVIFSCLFISGCSAGSSIDTTLVINEDLSGVRKMDIVIVNNVFKDYFNGTIEDLNNVIENNCPKELSFSYDEIDGVKTFHVELPFSSPEDYLTKVETITGKEQRVNMQVADSIWTSGFYVDEDFKSSDLLNWMKNAVIDAGYVSSGNAGYIFGDGDCVVQFQEQQYNSNNTICLDKWEYLPIDNIDFLTKIDDYGVYDRTVIFTIPYTTMNVKGEDIKIFFKEKLPNGAKGEWEEVENGNSIYSVCQENLDVAGIAVFDKTLFGTDNSGATIRTEELALSPFSFGETFDETIDFSQYIISESQSICVGYYAMAAENMVIGTSLFGIDEYEKYQVPDANMYEGYLCMDSSYIYGGNCLERSLAVKKPYKISSVDITTKKKVLGDFQRDIIFYFEDLPTEKEREIILERLNARSLCEDEKANEEEKDGIYCITLKQVGSAKEIANSTEMLTGANRLLTYDNHFSIGKLFYDEAFAETIYLGDLVYDKADGFVYNYKVDLGLGSKIKYVNEDEAVMSGHTVTYQTSSVPEIIIISRKFNLGALLFYLLIIVAILLIFIATVQSGVFKVVTEKSKQMLTRRKCENRECEIETHITVKKADAGRFCTNCGAPRDVDARVCVKCGIHFDDLED